MVRARGLGPDPNGVLVEVAGRRSYIHCTGQGAPVVVLEAGMGSMSSQWAWVQPGISRFARVCSYDRAGAGWSQSVRGPRDAAHVAADLEALLKATGEPGPYVLVGHSLGGVFARVFAGRYPASVAGLVLVDPTPLDLSLGWSDRLQASAMTESLPILFRLGVQPLRAQMEPLGRGLPPAAREDLLGSYGSLAHLEAFRDEYRAMAASNAQAKQAVLRHDLPVTVLSADLSMAAKQADMVKRAQAEHAQFAARFAGGRHRVIPGSNHLSLVTDPKNADQVVEEVGRLVELVRATPAAAAGS
jgi:pimeloyl-ACP methyl ester carboxylesterase